MAYFVAATVMDELNISGQKYTDLINNRWGPEVDDKINNRIESKVSAVPLNPVPAVITDISHVGIKSKYYEYSKMTDLAEVYWKQFEKDLDAYIDKINKKGTLTFQKTAGPEA